MRLIERLVSIYAPLTCLGCEVEADRLLCPHCSVTIPTVPSRCYRCRVSTRGYAVCTSCRKSTSLRVVSVRTYYDGLPKQLLKAVKYERARIGLEGVADSMVDLLCNYPDDVVIIPIPTATSRVRQRGYDQTEVLATEICERSGLRLVNALARIGQAHQVGSNRTERLKHLKGAFRIRKYHAVSGAHCVLVDDVLTTGATLDTAARCLRKAGARQVDAIVYCQAS